MDLQKSITSADQFILYLSMLRTIRYQIDSKKIDTVEKRNLEEKELELMKLLKTYSEKSSSVIKFIENVPTATRNKKIQSGQIKRRKT